MLGCASESVSFKQQIGFLELCEMLEMVPATGVCCNCMKLIPASGFRSLPVLKSENVFSLLFGLIFAAILFSKLTHCSIMDDFGARSAFKLARMFAKL